MGERIQKGLTNIDLEDVTTNQIWINNVYLQFHPESWVKISDKNSVSEEIFTIGRDTLLFLLKYIGSGKYHKKKEILLEGFGIIIN